MDALHQLERVVDLGEWHPSFSDCRYVMPREPVRANRHCRTRYDRALRLLMNQDFDKFAARAAPAIFVVLWSTGFVATKYVLNSAEPLTYLAIRMAAVVGLMAVIVAIARPKWPDRIGVAHSIVAGVLVHGFYLAGTAIAIAHSIPAGLSALIPGLQPILTSTFANRWLGERVTPLQWGGLLLGLGGVVLILHGRPMSGEAGWGWLASGVSLVSITLGTLYQRRYCGRIDWRAGNLVQYIAVTAFFAAGAWLFENNQVHWTGEFVLALVWLAVVLSIGSIGLLYWLIRHSAATSVASLFYLVPAVTALMAYVLFGERLDTVAIAGMVACAAAVFLVNRRA
jgi:drug/metabolite transporter (DMT)-like permease